MQGVTLWIIRRNELESGVQMNGNGVLFANKDRDVSRAQWGFLHRVCMHLILGRGY